MAKQDDYVRYTIRVPANLYAQIQAAAGEKSVNAEIAARLEGSFAPFDATRANEVVFRLVEALRPDAPDALKRSAEEAAILFVTGAPADTIRTIQITDTMERIPGTKPVLQGDAERAVLRPVLAYMQRKGWKVIPPEDDGLQSESPAGK